MDKNVDAKNKKNDIVPKGGKIIQFQLRESLLTQMLENSSHISTLHNIIMSFVAIFVIATIGDYIRQPSKFSDEFEMFVWNANDIGRFIQICIIMHLSVICLHYPLVLFNNFLQYRWLLNNSEKNLNNLFDMYQKRQYSGQIPQAFLYTAYTMISFFGIFLYGTNSVIVHDIKLSGSFAVLMETVRLLMKSHSFFIEKKDLHIEKEEIAKLIAQRQSNIVKSFWSLPSRARLRNLAYYLFAPTLIYSDYYPRTDKIRWSRVLKFGIQFIVAAMIGFLIFCRFVVANFSKTGIEPFPLNFNFLYKVFASGAAIYLIGFYGFLHTWHNFTAELMRFGDRHYYEDFWNVTSLKDYYRKWNRIVQLWLYVYIFLPINYRFHNRNLANNFVVLISAIMHEYILAVTIRFFFPVNFIFFAVVGQLIYFLENHDKNSSKQPSIKSILFHTNMFIGWGLLILFYSLEWHSKVNCPLPEQSTMLEKMTPRFIKCIKF
ncbi:sterol O-acyltransferase 1-like [Dermatophagoides pteronyssinus]|uniref:sterol O-acyltransferase 1-like n=1 Tax=Dermatophagoides pteronyssinus TaxID=6956 RepID=UPI003F67CB59